MSVVIRLAGEKDFSAIVKLLKKGRLNCEGVKEHLDNFLVVEDADKGEIVGTAGLEVFGDGCGLLRSLALSTESWNARIGLELVKILISFAAQKGLEAIYLLAAGPSREFFRYLGFAEAEWDSLPESVRQSTHLQQYSPELSTIMVYKRGNKPGQKWKN